MVYAEDSDQVTVTPETKDGVTTYTAVFNDKFYSQASGKLDRDVTFTSVKKVTENNFEIMGVEDVYYTGKAITFDGLSVFFNGRQLEMGTDYTVKYANNKNAGTASLTITGKGKFSGNVKTEFQIKPIDISTEACNANDLFLIGNKKAQKKASTLYWNGKAVAKSEYTVEFPGGAGDYKAAGEYIATIKAKGKNFTGSRNFKIFISDDEQKYVNVSKLKVVFNEDYLKLDGNGFDHELFAQRDEETGLPLAFSVMNKKVNVTAVFPEFWVDVDEMTGAGTLTMIANPTEEVDNLYYYGMITAKFTVKGKDISSLTINMPTEIVYPGETIYPDRLYSAGFSIKDKDADGNEIELRKGDHYTLTLKGNTKPGNMKVTITGGRGYSGKVTKTVKVTKPELNTLITNEELKIGCWDEEAGDLAMPEAVPFSKGGAVIDYFEVTRICSKTWVDENDEEHIDTWDMPLTLGKDYTVKYTNNTKAGSTAKLVVTGKGNYAGKIEKSFTVTERPISDTFIMVQDVKLGKKLSKTMKPYLGKVTVTDDVTGKVLKQKTDYTLKYYYFKNDGVNDIRVEMNASTKSADVFGTDPLELEGDGWYYEVEILPVEGSGYAAAVNENGETCTICRSYFMVKSTISAKEFKIKDQVLALNEGGGYEQWRYFAMPDNPGFDQGNCTDEEYKAWADLYFDKIPSDCRVKPIRETIKNGDKAGKTATITFEIVRNGEMDYNTGCRGGYVTLKFKVLSKNVVQD